MGEIVPFRIASRPRAVDAPPQGPAQILFFLGVRYVRDDGEKGGPKNRKSDAGARRTRRGKRA
ncbi:hypothetical protein K9U39_04005 [Rhodoblastus acidophilus]|uniref:Transposase n=1 Tax=Candidatus Rhodoblastus alkanivorans TaxID=2954117 RepID=A0ABS9Z556_9HYPH|nr:hypothetical protein [Candidatus Rhodoblastus alkanivorans]MCI4680540.1 hypothetical protein [Candidatus Rhodoblastus alkanivorans]MCI4682809.1 hypothetical protein [Candidatus Rhodoblastus alkanivorans]MDI4640118.1 hypothetical protein [Rhodoblastus acidophilus]